MNLNTFNTAMQLAQEAHEDKLADMYGDGKSEYSDSERASATQLKDDLQQASRRIAAAVARLQGDFDHQELMKYGPLSTDTAKDVMEILTGVRTPSVSAFQENA